MFYSRGWILLTQKRAGCKKTQKEPLLDGQNQSSYRLINLAEENPAEAFHVPPGGPWCPFLQPRPLRLTGLTTHARLMVVTYRGSSLLVRPTLGQENKMFSSSTEKCWLYEDELKSVLPREVLSRARCPPVLLPCTDPSFRKLKNWICLTKDHLAQTLCISLQSSLSLVKTPTQILTTHKVFITAENVRPRELNPFSLHCGNARGFFKKNKQ